MAATATPPRTDHDDASMASTARFDELFVQPVDTHHDHAVLPKLPSGWRHAGLVHRIARQPRERRETILAGGFALAAVLWAPLGVFAFMTRNALLFGALSLMAAAVAAAPRPATASVVVGEVADRTASVVGRLRPAFASARDRVGPALASARGRVGAALASARERVGPALASAREQLAPAMARLRDLAGRVVPAARVAGQRVAARLRAADQRIAAAVRSGLADLRNSGGGDHRTPSSAR